MAQNIRRHLSFANVASLAALVFAMGGTGYALRSRETASAARRSRRTASPRATSA